MSSSCGQIPSLTSKLAGLEFHKYPHCFNGRFVVATAVPSFLIGSGLFILDGIEDMQIINK